MSGEPIMPVHVRENKHVVLVFVDAASWRAMVERAAKADFLMHWRTTVMTERWDKVEEDMRGKFRSEAAARLRTALNLPDGWTPC